MNEQQHKKLIDGIGKKINDAINVPLNLIAPELHAEYRKDWNTYLGLLSENRDTEAASFLQKIIAKYDTKKDGV